jgi:hypothetical protein
MKLESNGQRDMGLCKGLPYAFKRQPGNRAKQVTL